MFPDDAQWSAKWVVSLLTLPLLSLIGCSFESPTQPSHLRIGSVEYALEASGTFTSDPDPRLGLTAKFGFNARALADSDGPYVYGVWFDGGLLPVGAHQFTMPDWGQPRGLWMFYTRPRGDVIDNYAIHAGTLTITASSPDLVEGQFEAEGWLTCTIPTDRPCPDMTGVVPPGAESIRLSGRFSLVPWDPSSVIPL